MFGNCFIQLRFREKLVCSHHSMAWKQCKKFSRCSFAQFAWDGSLFNNIMLAEMIAVVWLLQMLPSQLLKVSSCINIKLFSWLQVIAVWKTELVGNKKDLSIPGKWLRTTDQLSKVSTLRRKVEWIFIGSKTVGIKWMFTQVGDS